jgi:hypothetical protein
LDVTRRACRIAESIAEFLDRFVQSVIEINKNIGRPEAFPEFLTRDDLPWAFEEQRQGLNWLLRQPNLHSVLRELPGPEIQFEKAKADRIFDR